MSDEQREAARSWVQLVVNIGATIAMAISTWQFQQVTRLRSDVDGMMASRFTAADGLEVWKEIAAVKQSMAVLPTKTDVERIEVRQREIGERLIRIEEAVTRNHVKP